MNQLEYPILLLAGRRVVVLAEEPETPVAILIHEAVDTFANRLGIHGKGPKRDT